jgi:hypothetical protein
VRSEDEVRGELTRINVEYAILADRFALSELPWAQDVYVRALFELAARRAALQWLLQG